MLSAALCLLCLFSNPIFSQFTQGWDNLYGGDNFDELLSVVEVDDGIVYGASAGSFFTNIGDTPGTLGGTDFWIYKTDFDGNFIWSYTYGGITSDVLQNLIQTNDGGFIATGYSDSNTSGFKSQDSRGGRDIWVVKLDSNGGFEWDATYGGDQEDYGTTIVQAQDGSYFFGGWTQSLVSGEVSFPSRGGQFDYWLVHVSSNGTLLYDRRFGGPNDDRLLDMVVSSSGDLILTGVSDSNMGGEKSEDSNGGQDAWVIRMTVAGNIVWDKTYGGQLNEQSWSIEALPSGEILIGAYSRSNVSGNKTAVSLGGNDYWLIKTDASGEIIWDRVYGGNGEDELNEIKINDKGLIFLGGKSNSGISGDKTEIDRGSFDNWIVVVDDNDIVFYDKTFGGSLEDQLHDFICLEEGGILLAGFTISDTSGDITDFNNGIQDASAVLLECSLDQFLDIGPDQTICPNTNAQLDANTGQLNVCAYLWNDGNTDAQREVLIENDISYSVTVTDVFGCQAIDTISFSTLDGPDIDLGPNVFICELEEAILGSTLTACSGCTYLWDDGSTNPIRTVSPVANTTYEVAVTNSIGCTTIDQIGVSVFPRSTVRINDTTCDPAEARNDTIFSTNQFNCDSLTIFNIILLPSDTLRFNEGVCDPDLVGRDTFFETNTFDCDSLNIFTYFLLPSSEESLSSGTCDPDLVGIDTMFLTNEFGCDSIVIQELTALPSSENTFSFVSCDSIDVGVDTFMFSNQFGCDSVIINITDLIRSDITRFNESVCFTNLERLDTIVLTNDLGCDSLLITNYFFVASDTVLTREITCDPMEVRNDSTLIENPNGCDSLIVEIVTLAPSSEESDVVFTCDLDQVGLDTIYELNIFDCDSIIYREYELLRSDTIRFEDFICDAPAYIDTSFMINSVGCDSLVITSFAEASSESNMFDDFTCDASLEGLQVFNLINQFGCDSIVTIDYELVPAQVTNLEVNTCNPAQFMPDTVIYSSQLCDSLVITNYNVQQENFTTLNLVSCDESDVGEEVIVYSNVFGCDSTVTEIITFSEEDLNNIRLYECNRLDTLIEEFSFMNQFGCDSIVVVTTFPGLDTTFIDEIVCSLAEEFRDEQVFMSVEGCDSVVVNQGVFSEELETVFEIYTCDEDLIGSTSFSYTSQQGCDSIVMFNTVLGEIEIASNVENIPCGETNTGQISLEGSSGQLPYLYSFEGGPFTSQQVYSNLAVGTYQVAVQDLDGCESSTEIEIIEVTGVEIDLPDFVALDFGDPLILNPEIAGAYTEFFWTGVDTLFCATCLGQNYIPLESNAITFNVRSEDGCLEKHQVQFAVKKNYDVYIPNAFSPNGDSFNDFFTIYGSQNVEVIVSLQIFTRWGELVFDGLDIQPNIEQSGWNGIHKGGEINPGVFMYSAQIRFTDGIIKNFEGDLSLLR